MKKIEFIESYVKLDDGSDYQWSDNHGELVRCRDCRNRDFDNCPFNEFSELYKPGDDFYCADGAKKDD